MWKRFTNLGVRRCSQLRNVLYASATHMSFLQELQ